MAKLTLSDIGAGGLGAATLINTNNGLLEAALENTLSRDGTTPNQMEANLDMNSYRIQNLPQAVSNTEPVTLAQAASIAGVTNPLTQESVAGVLWPRTTAEVSAGVTPTNYEYPEGHILRYGTNASPGVTDMTTALRNAQAVIDAAGGGTVTFEKATYLLSTVSTHSVVVPVAGANFTDSTENHQYHVLLDASDNIVWEGNGATLVSDVTNGGEMFILDGVRNFEARNLNIQGETVHNSSGTVTTTGMNGFGITSQDRDSYNIKFTNVVATNVYAALYFFGAATSSYRVRGIGIDNHRSVDGIYSIACHNNGDDLSATGCQSSNELREYFVYGVSNHDVQMFSDTAVAGFGSLIKAYDRDTTQIRYKLRTTRDTTDRNVGLQSQHAPGTQATPNRLLNIEVNVNNAGNTVNTGVAVGFEYYRDSTLTSTTTNNLFDGIVLKGVYEQPPEVDVTQNATGARGYLNTDGVTLLNGSLYSIYNNTGFFDSKQTYNTFTPELQFGGGATGMTYGTQTGEFWRDGRFIEAIIRIVLTAKGSSTGTATVSLPVTSADNNALNPVVLGEGRASMATLGGNITGFVSNGGTTLTLETQGATATSVLTHANFTDTSDILLHIRYPL